MFDSLQVMGLCTWVSGRWACVCTWADMYVPGQVCVYLGRHVCVPGKACMYMDRYVCTWANVCTCTGMCVCVHEQACVCTWTDMCIHEQGMCEAYTMAVTQRSSQEEHTAEPVLLTSLVLSLQSHVWRGGSFGHLHTRSPALLPGLERPRAECGTHSDGQQPGSTVLQF